MDCNGSGKTEEARSCRAEEVESQEATVKIEPREIMAWTRVVTVKLVKIGQILHVLGRQNDRIKKISIQRSKQFEYKIIVSLCSIKHSKE